MYLQVGKLYFIPEGHRPILKCGFVKVTGLLRPRIHTPLNGFYIQPVLCSTYSNMDHTGKPPVSIVYVETTWSTSVQKKNNSKRFSEAFVSKAETTLSVFRIYKSSNMSSLRSKLCTVPVQGCMFSTFDSFDLHLL